MSRVLIVSNHYSTIYNFRRELLSRLVSDGHEVIISLPKDEKNDAFKKMGCRVEESEITRYGTNPIKELKLIFDYKKLIKSIKPDIVLTYTAKPNVYGSIAARMCKIPYINNVTGLGSNFQSESLIKKILIFLQKIAYKKSLCVFMQNSENMEYFKSKKIVGEQAKLLPGSGVNLDLHAFVPYPKESEKIKFIFVSRIRQDKGFDEFFDAVKIISKKHSNVEFHIAGWFEDDEYRKKIEDMKENHPCIYHGSLEQSEVHRVLSECHCLVFPSYHEGMSNVLLEGAACGRPCLASDIAGCRETIDNGVTGFLFKVKDAQSLAESMEKFLAVSYDKKAEMGKKGREKMEREFDRNIVVEEYMKYINALK